MQNMQLDTKVAVLLAVVVSVAVTAGITYMIYPQAPQASDPEPATGRACSGAIWRDKRDQEDLVARGVEGRP